MIDMTVTGVGIRLNRLSEFLRCCSLDRPMIPRGTKVKGLFLDRTFRGVSSSSKVSLVSLS